MANLKQFPTVAKSFDADKHGVLYRVDQGSGNKRLATIEDVHNAIIEARKQPQEVVDRHKNKITSVLANVPPNKQAQFANVLTGAALNFLTDEQWDECVNVARMFVSCDEGKADN